MARLVTAGAESKDATIEGRTLSANTTYDTGTVRSGAVSWKCDSTAGNVVATTIGAFTYVLGTTYYARAYFNFTTLPTAAATRLIEVGGNYVVRIKSDNKLYLTNLTGGTFDIGSPSAALVTGTWYRIEVAFKIDTGALDYAELMLDGVSVASETNANRTDSPFTALNIGLNQAPGASIVCYVDDIALNDSSGGSQNSWPGAGNVVMLRPTADSAVGAGWTLGSGGTPLFGGVDDSPPAGVADAGTTAQIRNATSNANVNYDATMTTYTAAGVPAGATVNVVDPIVATAAPVVTSAKAGTVGVASNPTIANVALGAGGTPGAFWSGVTAGTYPTGWKISHGTITYAPAVTLGTAPVMRLTQVTSSTRIAMACFMGIYVDYTPGAAAEVIPDLTMAPLSHA
jgi:hypothetical protein